MQIRIKGFLNKSWRQKIARYDICKGTMLWCSEFEKFHWLKLLRLVLDFSKNILINYWNNESKRLSVTTNMTTLIRDRPLHCAQSGQQQQRLRCPQQPAASVREPTLLYFWNSKTFSTYKKFSTFIWGQSPILLSYTLLHCYDVGWTHSYERHSKIGLALSPRFVPSRCFLLLIVCSGRIVLHSLLLLVLF